MSLVPWGGGGGGGGGGGEACRLTMCCRLVRCQLEQGEVVVTRKSCTIGTRKTFEILQANLLVSVVH